MDPVTNSNTRIIYWDGHAVGLLDQTLLPLEEREILCHTLPALWEAIKNLRVRGAPAIGVAAAYGVVLAGKASQETAPERFAGEVRRGCDYLAASRPTAVNLFWALGRMRRAL